MLRYMRWQIGSRLLPGAVHVPFVNDTVLVVSPGMAGATQNIYTGLSDFADCSFLMHVLRRGDLFVDIGSNVGVYSVLAAGVAQAEAIAVEPVPDTYKRLCANIRANSLTDRVTACNLGLGRREELLRFTVEADCMNRVITDEHWSGASVEVPVYPLDALLKGRNPTVMKLDVEGWESEVLAGAGATLQNPSLLALIVEMDGATAEFNSNEAAVHQCLTDNGFSTLSYDPFTRTLKQLSTKNVGAANTIYARNLSEIRSRIASAERFCVNGREI